jgi:hypothetical protein
MVNVDKYLTHIQEIDPITGTMIVLSAASLIVSATNMYKQHFTKGSRQCSDLADKERSLCMLRAKALAKKVEAAALKDGVNKCNKTKNPQQCKQKLLMKMKKVSGEIGYLNSRFADAKKRV